MKTIEIIGAAVFVWLAYLVLLCLDSSRDEAEKNRRIYDNERYKRPKK